MSVKVEGLDENVEESWASNRKNSDAAVGNSISFVKKLFIAANGSYVFLKNIIQSYVFVENVIENVHSAPTLFVQTSY